jgi:hypothetical protein
MGEHKTMMTSHSQAAGDKYPANCHAKSVQVIKDFTIVGKMDEAKILNSRTRLWSEEGLMGNV